jgi:hypothetical protein
MFWICGKPAFFYAPLLLVKLKDTPESRKADYCTKIGRQHVIYKRRNSARDKAQRQKRGPRLFSKMIFRLYNNRVKYTDNNERRKTCYYTCYVHTSTSFYMTFPSLLFINRPVNIHARRLITGRCTRTVG